MLERSILWSIYCVGNLKPLGKQKDLPTHSLEVDSIDDHITNYDFIITLSVALQLAPTNDREGRGPPDPPC